MTTNTPSDCPFCVRNGMVVFIDQNEEAFLVAAKNDGEVMRGCYLIIPRRHIESIRDLPPNWQTYVTDLVESVPGLTHGVPYNLSYNFGHEAGQKIAHLHCWVILRKFEEHEPSQGYGLATLIRARNMLG